MQKSIDLLVTGVLLTNGVNAAAIDNNLQITEAQISTESFYDTYRAKKPTVDPYADWNFESSDSDDNYRPRRRTRRSNYNPRPVYDDSSSDDDYNRRPRGRRYYSDSSSSDDYERRGRRYRSRYSSSSSSLYFESLDYASGLDFLS